MKTNPSHATPSLSKHSRYRTLCFLRVRRVSVVGSIQHIHHRDTENTEEAQRRQDSFAYERKLPFGCGKWLARSVLLLLLCALRSPLHVVVSQTIYDLHESERSDKVTGGEIETAEFEPGEPDIRITLNVPSFLLTLWQNGKEVKSYFVGVGLKDHPIYIGDREAYEIIWNPVWIPPPSDWVREKKGVQPGEIIKASDPRNPLGKLKIPLGDSYLIHEAAKRTDLGNLVSHGCVRMLRANLYDLAEKIIAARSAPVSRKRIEAAKRSFRTVVVRLDEPLPVDINYDTLVVEKRQLHIYPDVYGRRMNQPSRLRQELESSGVNTSMLDDTTMKRMLARATKHVQFVVDISSIEEGRALEDGRMVPVIGKESGQRRPSQGR